MRELIRKILNESDPKTGTGKKPEGSGRRLYTDENPNDTVSVKFRTKEDIVDTLNKESFKSKPHKRQSQIINLIHQRVRAAYQNAKDPETKKRLKRAYDYIESEKEKSKEKTVRLQKQKVNEEVPSQVRRRIPNFEETFKHYRDAFSKYTHRNFNIYWNAVIERVSETLYHAWFVNTVPDDDWEESEKYIQDYLTKKYYNETEKMWEKKRYKRLNESEEKNQSLLSLIKEHGLYEFIKMTGLSMGQIILKYDNLPREVFERYIKDFINEEGYHQTDGSVQLGYEVEIQTHVYIDHFYMKGDKVTVEIKRFDYRGHQSEGYIESLSNLTDEEIFNIVDDMTSWGEDIDYEI